MIRTPGILLPKQARYQLRYAPIQFCGLISSILPKQARYQLRYTPMVSISRHTLYYTTPVEIVNSSALYGSGHKARLKEINKSKGDFPFGMVKAIVVFGNTKTIISGYKDFYYRIKSFQLSRETPASSGKNRDIMAQISVDTLNSESVLFVVNIVNMPSRINHIQVAAVSVCVISTGFWRGIYDLLYPL